MIAPRDLGVTNKLQAGAGVTPFQLFPFLTQLDPQSMPTKGSSHGKSLLSHLPLGPYLAEERQYKSMDPRWEGFTRKGGLIPSIPPACPPSIHRGGGVKATQGDHLPICPSLRSSLILVSAHVVQG